MARKQVVVCDVCEAVGKPTTRYRITREGQRFEVDLCVDHAKRIEALLSGKASARATPARFEDTFATFEEIEARKRQRQSESA